MAWIEVHSELRSHPKVFRLARSLNIPKAQALGHVVALWLWALDFAPDGDLSKFHADEVADGAQFDGGPDVFIAALESACLIDRTPDGATIHDWQEYVGRLLAMRENNRRRQATFRARIHEGGNNMKALPNGYVTVTPPLCSAAPYLTSPTVPNHDDDVAATGKNNGATNAMSLYLDCHANQINQIEAQRLQEMIDEYTDNWVAESIRVAVNAGKTSPPLNYLDAILSDWSSNGFKAPRQLRQPDKPQKKEYIPMLGCHPDPGVI